LRFVALEIARAVESASSRDDAALVDVAQLAARRAVEAKTGRKPVGLVTLTRLDALRRAGLLLRRRRRAAEDPDLLEPDGRARSARAVAFDARNLLHDLVAGHDFAEHRVAPIEVGRVALGDEPLRSVGARARVRHGEDAGALVA